MTPDFNFLLRILSYYTFSFPKTSTCFYQSPFDFSLRLSLEVIFLFPLLLLCLSLPHPNLSMCLSPTHLHVSALNSTQHSKCISSVLSTGEGSSPSTCYVAEELIGLLFCESTLLAHIRLDAHQYPIRAFSVNLLSSWLSPSLCWYMRLLLPNHRPWHFSLLNFTNFLQAHFFIVFRFL